MADAPHEQPHAEDAERERTIPDTTAAFLKRDRDSLRKLCLRLPSGDRPQTPEDWQRMEEVWSAACYDLHLVEFDRLIDLAHGRELAGTWPDSSEPVPEGIGAHFRRKPAALADAVSSLIGLKHLPSDILSAPRVRDTLKRLAAELSASGPSAETYTLARTARNEMVWVRVQERWLEIVRERKAPYILRNFPHSGTLRHPFRNAPLAGARAGHSLRGWVQVEVLRSRLQLEFDAPALVDVNVDSAADVLAAVPRILTPAVFKAWAWCWTAAEREKRPTFWYTPTTMLRATGHKVRDRGAFDSDAVASADERLAVLCSTFMTIGRRRNGRGVRLRFALLRHEQRAMSDGAFREPGLTWPPKRSRGRQRVDEFALAKDLWVMAGPDGNAFFPWDERALHELDDEGFRLYMKLLGKMRQNPEGARDDPPRWAVDLDRLTADAGVFRHAGRQFRRSCEYVREALDRMRTARLLDGELFQRPSGTWAVGWTGPAHIVQPLANVAACRVAWRRKASRQIGGHVAQQGSK